MICFNFGFYSLSFFFCNILKKLESILSKLYKDGFRGKVYTTTATRDLMSVALPDNMKLILDEAKEMGHEPLFRREDLDGLMSLVEGVFYNEPIKLDGITAIFHDAGHILGSSIIVFDAEGKRIVFTGDLGNSPAPILKPMEYVDRADYVIIESAYGNRVHESRNDRKKILEQTIEDTVARGGGLALLLVRFDDDYAVPWLEVPWEQARSRSSRHTSASPRSLSAFSSALSRSRSRSGSRLW